MSAPDFPLLRAARRERTAFTPLWLMRQAGRFLPEYRAMRARYGFLELCKNPEAAAEVTLQPIDRLGVDAAILFADILLLVEPLGVGLEFAKGEGPVIHRPVRGAADVARLQPVDVDSAVPFVFETVRTVVRALGGRVPLIGFAGAPFTVASYVVEGGASRDYLHVKRLMYERPAAWQRLMDVLVDGTARYLNGQIAAGADGVQVFDSWVGAVPRAGGPARREAPARPHLQPRARHPQRHAGRARESARGDRPRAVRSPVAPCATTRCCSSPSVARRVRTRSARSSRS